MALTRRTRSARVAATVGLVLSLAATVTGIVFDVLAFPAAGTAPFTAGWTGYLPGLALVIPGALLMWRLPWHPIASVLLVFGTLYAIDGPAAAYVNWAIAFFPEAPLADWAFWYYARFGSVLILPVPLLLTLFPDGRMRGGVWRVVSLGAIALTATLPLAFTLAPSRVLAARQGIAPGEGVLRYDHPPITVELPDAVWAGILSSMGAVLACAFLLSLSVIIGRRFGATRTEKSQLRWLTWAGALFLLQLLIAGFLPPFLVDLTSILTHAVVGWSVLFAVTQHRLYEIDRLLSWTIVYGVLIGTIVVVDVALVALVGSLLDDRVAGIVAVVIVVLLYAPVRERLLTVVARVVNGGRADPYGVVSSLASRLEESIDPDAQLVEVVDAVAKAFATPYVRLELDRADGGRLVAEHGRAQGKIITLPVTYRRETIGRLVMAPGRQPRLSVRDQQLLADLVRQAAAAIRATAMSEELQVIRERLVTAREEERHRLRRDLHDGLGPALAAVKLRIETARNLLASQPDVADELLDGAALDTSEAVADIRRLVHDLRPPALDDLGLARSIEQQCARFGSAGDAALVVDCDVQIPQKLPAAVEVAAYRIVSEALNNVARHSRATRCWVLVVAQSGDESQLSISVADNGMGIAPDALAGVGLASQRERALELGGTWSVTARDGGGTVVRATLPIVTTAKEPQGVR